MCNDKSINEGRGTGIGTDETYYAGYDRLNDSTTANPTFRCPDSNGITIYGKNLSRFTSGTSIDNRGNSELNFPKNSINQSYKIGLLTADEVAYAGGKMNTANKLYYLYQNTTGSTQSRSIWTMTPNRFNTYAFVFTVGSGGLYATTASGSGNSGATAIRPSIALIPSVTYTTTSNENIGSSENPFIIGA